MTPIVLSVDEGQYTVRGCLLVGSHVLTAQAAGIAAKPGQTSTVRLDFGPLDGRVRVTARASGQDVSNRVDIRVLKAATVRAGQDAYVDVDLGELPATLEVTATYRGAVISNLCQLSVFAPGHGCTSEARPLTSPLAFLGPSWGILTTVLDVQQAVWRRALKRRHG